MSDFPAGAKPRLTAVMAVARNGVIGAAGGMPWHLPSDFKRYRRLTMGRPMIMGRKTLESIGRVLDGRDTIVMTRDPSFTFPGAIVAPSREAALEAAHAAARRRGGDEIVIVGGAAVFEAFLADLDRVELTEIEAEPAGDTFLPPLDPQLWVKLHQEAMPRTQGDSADAMFCTYVRRVEAPQSTAKDMG